MRQEILVHLLWIHQRISIAMPPIPTCDRVEFESEVCQTG